MKRRIVSENGFTLLEVMTSLAILSFSLLMLLHMAMIALDGNSWASGTTSSTQLIQEKLEELRIQADPVSGYDSVPMLSVGDTLGFVSRTWRVSTVASHLRQVEITAVWLSPDSIAHSNTVSTMIKTDSL